MEARQREQAQEDYCKRLGRTESEMWGLGIAGLFHQWERNTKGAILAFSDKPPARLERKDFQGMCSLVEGLGFDITQCPAFTALETARMISNTVKHGDGREFRALIARHPELTPGFKPSRRRKDPHADDLRLTVREFDAAAAIGQIWAAFEKAKSPVPDRLCRLAA